MKILYADGFVIGNNPSPVGGGYVVCDEHSNIVEEHTIRKHYFTNNESELLGVCAALKLIDTDGEVYTDSENTIKWIKKGFCKARPDLNDACVEAKNLMFNKRVKLLWIRRNENLAGLINDGEGVTYEEYNPQYGIYQ